MATYIQNLIAAMWYNIMYVLKKDQSLVCQKPYRLNERLTDPDSGFEQNPWPTNHTSNLISSEWTQYNVIKCNTIIAARNSQVIVYV